MTAVCKSQAETLSREIEAERAAAQEMESEHKTMVKSTTVSVCRPLPPLIASHCLSLPLAASRYLSLPLATSHYLSLPLATSHCLSLPLTASRYLSLPLAASHCLSLSLAASHCLSLPLTIFHCLKICPSRADSPLILTPATASNPCHCLGPNVQSTQGNQLWLCCRC